MKGSSEYNDKAKERTMRYMKDKRDRIVVGVPKGDKQKYTLYANSRGMSLNKLIVTLLENEIKKPLSGEQGSIEISNDISNED